MGAIADTIADTSGALVFCTIACHSDGSELVHIFSTPEKRMDFWRIHADMDGSIHLLVHYDYVIDDPLRCYRRASEIN